MPSSYSTTIVAVANFIKTTHPQPTPSTVVVGYFDANREMRKMTYNAGTPSQFVYGIRHPMRMSRDMLDQFLSATQGESTNAGARYAWGLFDTALRDYTNASAEWSSLNPGLTFANASLPESLVTKWRHMCERYVLAWKTAMPLAVAVALSGYVMPTAVPQQTATSPVAPTAISSSPSAQSLGIPDLTNLSADAQAGTMSAQRANSATLVGPGTLDTSPASAPTTAAQVPMTTVAAGSSPRVVLTAAPDMAPIPLEEKITDKPWFWPVTIGGGALVLALLFKKK